MTDLKDKFEPMDIIAILMIVGSFACWIVKKDPTFKDVMLSISMFYFGNKISIKNKN